MKKIKNLFSNPRSRPYNEYQKALARAYSVSQSMAAAQAILKQQGQNAAPVVFDDFFSQYNTKFIETYGLVAMNLQLNSLAMDLNVAPMRSAISPSDPAKLIKTTEKLNLFIDMCHKYQMMFKNISDYLVTNYKLFTGDNPDPVEIKKVCTQMKMAHELIDLTFQAREEWMLSYHEID